MIEEFMYSYMNFWGKAMPRDNALVSSHPAAFHMLDVAACFDYLFEYYLPSWINPRLKRILTFLVAIHDVGKLTLSFQWQSEENWSSFLGPYPSKRGGNTRHDTLGFHILYGTKLYDDFFKEIDPSSRMSSHWMPLLQAVCGHHGRPPLNFSEPIGFETNDFSSTCRTATELLLKDFKKLLVTDTVALRLTSNQAKRLGWWLSGMANLADWLGSSEWFRYAYPDDFDSVSDYWEHAKVVATKACRESGVIPSRPATEKTFAEMFNISTPYPVQAWCAAAHLPCGPKLIFIEDETGNGKTEAALMLAQRLIANGDGRGIFYGLPTMATANAMFERILEHAHSFYAPGERPSVALMHGKTRLNRKFREITIQSTDGEPDSVDDPNDPEAKSAICAEWLASDNRRAFLADIGVGTIDQAMLSVMPSKFATLRRLGLGQKILIIDEAHAYDSYIMEILKVILFVHARAGGSAIILSATLPLSMRNELAAAYHKGLCDD